MFQARMEGDTLIVSIMGQLILGNRPDFKSLMVARLAEADIAKVVCDFTQCDYIDSAGLGVLVSVNKKSQGLGKGRIYLTGFNDDLRTLFELTKLEDLFEIYSTSELALRSIACDTLGNPEE